MNYELTIEPGRYTKYEKARMIGSRALQIAMGAPALVKLTKKQLEEIKFNPVEIAKLELELKEARDLVQRMLEQAPKPSSPPDPVSSPEVV